MSDYVVHFTKDQEGVGAYDAMMGILAAGTIEARTAFGAATNLDLGASQLSACFSEIPLDVLARLVARRSLFGIGFHQTLLIAKGGGRVWYLDPGTPQKEAFYRTVTEAMKGGINQDDPVWQLTPFVDYTAPNYRFEWEREWRLPGGLRFTPDEVAFLFVPDEFHNAARAFLANGGDGAGPAYRCPILDPRWDDEQVQATLAALPPSPD